MDLISREEAINSIYDGTSYDVLTEECKRHIEEVPSAFEGKTFGEVFKSVFANYIGGVYVGEYYVEVAFNDIKTHISYYPIEVWDSPYKGVNE